MCIPSEGTFFLVSGGLHTVSWGQWWDNLNAILGVSEGVCSPVLSRRMIAVREALQEGLWLWEQLQCLLGEQLDLHLLSGRLCLNLL